MYRERSTPPSARKSICEGAIKDLECTIVLYSVGYKARCISSFMSVSLIQLGMALYMVGT